MSISMSSNMNLRYFKIQFGTTTEFVDRKTLLDGVPEHIGNFPKEYGLEECGRGAMP